jgi:uncharacterized lipoprotein YbaY
MRVFGSVLLPKDDRALRSASIRVRIEDVSRADAAAQLLGELVIAAISDAEVEQGRVPFEIELDDRAASDRAALTIRAHVDVDADGKVGPGDFVTTEYIAVPRDTVGPLLVPVRRVGSRSPTGGRP